MSRFKEMLELAKNPPEGFSFSTDYLNDLESAYMDEFTAIEQDYAARLAEATGTNDLANSRIQELESTISALKSKNYDLLMSLPADNPADDSPEEDNSDDDGVTVDDLFE